MAKQKKKLSQPQEFEIMKLVLDKFLWLGFVIMAVGLYTIIATQNIYRGFTYIVVGAVVLVLFMIFIVREYEIVK